VLSLPFERTGSADDISFALNDEVLLGGPISFERTGSADDADLSALNDEVLLGGLISFERTGSVDDANFSALNDEVLLGGPISWSYSNEISEEENLEVGFRLFSSSSCLPTKPLEVPGGEPPTSR